jgi:hypothetical protein
VTIAGCKGERVGTLSLDIPFRADGILEFARPDGSLITRIAIEIAESDSAQVRGLMDRRSLPSRGGMLFVYPDTASRSFWMRSTPLPLDILFIREDGTVANVVRRTTPYSDAHIRSDGGVQNVLEVRAGFTEQWNINAGTRIRWRRAAGQTPP